MFGLILWLVLFGISASISVKLATMYVEYTPDLQDWEILAVYLFAVLGLLFEASTMFLVFY